MMNRTTLQEPTVLAASKIIGDRVRNAAGEDLGKIEDLMVDLERGRIGYAVLSFGGFLGMGDKLFAIPWSALTRRHEDETFMLNVDKEVLERAPGFDKNNWPDMTASSWGSEIHSYYGYRPYWEI
jgi:sporulation protein YlmC with PRC-barrel domain